MTDHYEMPHARADECPHAGVGKACRPCRDRFERAAIRDVLALHRHEWSCGNPAHTNPDVGCPECGEYCTECGDPFPCRTYTAVTAHIDTTPTPKEKP